MRKNTIVKVCIWSLIIMSVIGVVSVWSFSRIGASNGCLILLVILLGWLGLTCCAVIVESMESRAESARKAEIERDAMKNAHSMEMARLAYVHEKELKELEIKMKTVSTRSRSF